MLEKYFPFTGETYKPSMGVKPLRLEDWIEFGDDRAMQLAEKSRLLAKHRDLVLRGSLECADAAIELREMVRSYVEVGQSDDPLIEVSLATQEDWALLSPKPPVRLERACICFPSRWSLAQKVGRESDEIHAPVPAFSTIAKSTKNFLERLQPDKPMWRLNWSIHDSDVLFANGPHPAKPGLDAGNVLQETFVRIEKQTLRKLPRTGYVAFSIRTFLHPMTEVVADSGRASLVLSTLEKIDSDTIAYKGMSAFAPLLIATLRNAT